MPAPRTPHARAPLAALCACGAPPAQTFFHRLAERDPHSPLHSPSPLRSLSAARRARTHERAARARAAEERLLLKSVSPHEVLGGRGASAPAGSQPHDGGARAPEGKGRGAQGRYWGDVVREQAVAAHAPGGEAGRRPAGSERPRSPHRTYLRRGQNEPGSPVYQAPTSTAPQRHGALRDRGGGGGECNGETRAADNSAATACGGRSDAAGAEEHSAGSSTVHGMLQVPREGRRRGYFANLGANAPGSPLHPSFDDTRATTPSGSPRSVSPRRVATDNGPQSYPHSEEAPVTSARATGPSRTASLPTPHAPRWHRDRSPGRNARRPASARTGRILKHCSKQADSRPSRSTPLAQDHARLSKHRRAVHASGTKGFQQHETHLMESEIAADSTTALQLDNDCSSDLTHSSGGWSDQRLNDAQTARSDEAKAATNPLAGPCHHEASASASGPSTFGGSSPPREDSKSARQTTSRMQISSSLSSMPSWHRTAGASENKKEPQPLQDTMRPSWPGGGRAQDLTGMPGQAPSDRQGKLQGEQHRDPAGKGQEQLAIDKSKAMGDGLVELMNHLQSRLQQSMASRRRDIMQVQNCALQVHGPNAASHLEACDACADAMLRENWRVKEENGTIKSWYDQASALLLPRQPKQLRTIQQAAARQDTVAAERQGKRGLAAAGTRAAPKKMPVVAPAPRNGIAQARRQHSVQVGRKLGRGACLWHSLLDSGGMPARAVVLPPAGRSSFFNGGNPPKGTWPPQVRNHAVNDDSSGIAAESAASLQLLHA
jgi:hypothetical protein